MPETTEVPDHRCWREAPAAGAEVTASGANVQITIGSVRITMTPPQARRLAEILLARADEAARAAAGEER
jgi:hypothetical protein